MIILFTVMLVAHILVGVFGGAALARWAVSKTPEPLKDPVAAVIIICWVILILGLLSQSTIWMFW